METFLDKNLRHSQSNLNDLTEKVRNAELPESIASLYELCLKAEKEQDFINSRDVKLATGFLIQLLFFASPILYSIDNLSLKLKLILFLNPLTFIIENMRWCIIEGRGVVLWQFTIVAIIVAIFYYLSYKYFIKTERDFADVI